MGVLIPFLYHNIWGKQEKNQKIFMGDSGSLTLGYILGVLLIKFCMYNPHVMPYQKGATPPFRNLTPRTNLRCVQSYHRSNPTPQTNLQSG